MDTSEQPYIPPKIKRSREEREESSSKVIRTSGGSRGQVSQDIDIDIDEVEWIERKENLLGERMPVIRWTDGDKRKGIQVCSIQNTAGQYYLWETDAGNHDVALTESVRKNGGRYDCSQASDSFTVPWPCPFGDSLSYRTRPVQFSPLLVPTGL